MTKEYTVYCHRCEMVPYAPNGERWPEGLGEVGKNPCAHRRSDAVLRGNAEFGGLWHCKAHADDCPRCPETLYGRATNPTEQDYVRRHSAALA